jgi:hypothetical protein
LTRSSARRLDRHGPKVDLVGWADDAVVVLVGATAEGSGGVIPFGKAPPLGQRPDGVGARD